MEARGKVHRVFPTQETSPTFRKRELVLLYGDNPKYPNYVTFEYSQDRVSMLDALQPGMEVEVSFDLSGRQWINPQGEEKYFNALRAFNVKVLNLSQPHHVSQPLSQVAAQAQAGRAKVAGGNVAADIEQAQGDDLPF